MGAVRVLSREGMLLQRLVVVGFALAVVRVRVRVLVLELLVLELEPVPVLVPALVRVHHGASR